ncbi:squamous cell carcinoma antigen recognized by T-cells 3 isoform X2 [Dermacentor silvarum]|uniref:squamous cell carcinoma antigen recognized by T-cells 3 isoform X2 n=1 Tax=Dermacentor silvarum TaxID=543639 RepID=UPI001898B7A3|nr:squamous cell carcinoma antigen recognized by T-cells 3 isoform X2 [Dermacentor silvarum]
MPNKGLSGCGRCLSGRSRLPASTSPRAPSCGRPTASSRSASCLPSRQGPVKRAHRSSGSSTVAQRNRIYSLFKRQLSVPLFGMEKTYQELKEWSEAAIEPSVEHLYKKAKLKLEKVQEYETALLCEDDRGVPDLSTYLPYLEWEQAQGDPARIQCLYERALAQHCLVADLWERYMAYLDNQLKVESVSLPCHERSVRNCPWSASLWASYLKALERSHAEHNKVKETMEQALQAGFSQGQDYQRLWLAFLDYLRRRVDAHSAQGDELLTPYVEDLRASFQKAVEHLLQYSSTEDDICGPVLKYWAKVEAKVCRNLPRARELWNDITNQGRATDAQTWLDYANFERTFGDDKHYRKVLFRGMYAAVDWPETLGDLLLRFEREEGTLETLDVATEKYEAHMRRVLDKREKAAAREAAREAEQEAQKKIHRAEKKAEKKAEKAAEKAEKKAERKAERHAEKRREAEAKVFQRVPPGYAKRKAQPPREPPDNQEQATDKDGFKVPLLPAAKAAATAAEEPPSKKQKTEGEEESVGKEESPKHGEVVKPDPLKDIRTVFLSNLAFDVEEEQITEAFKEVGEIEELRLVRDYKGRSKGFGYLVFTHMQNVEAALKRDRTPVNGRPVFVSKCNERNQFKFRTAMEKNKLFVKGIPFSVTEKELEELFGKYGELKGVRLVTYRNGHSKGIAYVEYANETSATVALVQTDGMSMGDQTLQVAISNPPARGARQQGKWDSAEDGQQGSQFPLASQVASLGGGPKETGLRGRGRTQVSLMPRAVQQRSSTTAVVKKPEQKQEQPMEVSDSSAEGSKGLSNEDFRSMLLKK